MLSLYKRGEVWHIRGTITDGERVVKVRRSTGQTVKREAEQVVRYVERTVLNDMRGGVKMLPFTTVADSWLNQRPRGATARSHINILKTHFKRFQADQINKDAWNNFIAEKLSTSKSSNVNRYRATLLAVLNNASIPVELPRMKEVNDRVRFLSIEQQNKLLDEYPEYIRPLFITLCYQGLRLSEALRLRRQHVNFETKKMLIEKTKTGQRRILPVHPRTVDTICGISTDYFFLNSRGERYADPRNLRGVHRRACERAGVYDFTIHDWRHHWASQLMMKGGTLGALQKLGGWQSQSMVFRYAAVNDEHITDTLMRLE